MQNHIPDAAISLKEDQSELSDVLEDILSDLVDDAILGECFEMHQDHKLKILRIDSETEMRRSSDFSYVSKCTLCERYVDMRTFATHHLPIHFERNRQSSRIANQKIKSVASDELDFVDDEGTSYPRPSTRRNKGKNRGRGSRVKKNDSQCQ